MKYVIYNLMIFLFLVCSGCAPSGPLVVPVHNHGAMSNTLHHQFPTDVYDAAEQMATHYVQRVNDFLDSQTGNYLLPEGERFKVYIQGITNLQNDETSFVAMQFLALFRSRLINRLHQPDAARVGDVMINGTGLKALRDYESFAQENEDFVDFTGHGVDNGANCVLVISTKIGTSKELYLAYELILNNEPLLTLDTKLQLDWPEVQNWKVMYRQSVVKSQWRDKSKQLHSNLRKSERLMVADPGMSLAIAGTVWRETQFFSRMTTLDIQSEQDIALLKEDVRKMVSQILAYIRFNHGVFRQVLFSPQDNDPVTVWAHDRGQADKPVASLKLKLEQQGTSVVKRAVTGKSGMANFSTAGLKNGEVVVRVDLAAYDLPDKWQKRKAYSFLLVDCSGEFKGMIAYAVQKLLHQSEWHSDFYSPIFIASVKTSNGFGSSGSEQGWKIRSEILNKLSEIPGLKLEAELHRGGKRLNTRARLSTSYYVDLADSVGYVKLELRPDKNPMQVLFSESSFPLSHAAYLPPPALPDSPAQAAFLSQLFVDVQHEQGKNGDFRERDDKRGSFHYYLRFGEDVRSVFLFYRSGNNWEQTYHTFRPSSSLSIVPKIKDRAINIKGENEIDEIWAFVSDQYVMDSTWLMGRRTISSERGFDAIYNKIRLYGGRVGYDHAQLTILSKK